MRFENALQKAANHFQPGLCELRLEEAGVLSGLGAGPGVRGRALSCLYQRRAGALEQTIFSFPFLTPSHRFLEEARGCQAGEEREVKRQCRRRRRSGALGAARLWHCPGAAASASPSCLAPRGAVVCRCSGGSVLLRGIDRPLKGRRELGGTNWFLWRSRSNVFMKFRYNKR